MPKRRIGLSLDTDVLAILNKYGRCEFKEGVSHAADCETCGELYSHERHSRKRPTRTEITEEAIREWQQRRLPKAADILGSDPDFTGAESTDEYIARIRGRSAPVDDRDPDEILREAQRKLEERRAENSKAPVADALADRRALGDTVSAAFEAMGHRVVDVTPADEEAEADGERSSFNDPETAKKKAGRRERKANLDRAVKNALGNHDGGTALDAVGPPLEGGRGKATVETQPFRGSFPKPEKKR